MGLSDAPFYQPMANMSSDELTSIFNNEVSTVGQQVAAANELASAAGTTISIGPESIVPDGNVLAEPSNIAVKSLGQADNYGFEGDSAEATTLQPGTMIDRYGPPSGSFLSPQGTPFNMRGLPLEYLNRPLTTYQVVRPIEVFRGVASEYGEGGGGMQYFLGEDSNGESVTVEKLLESGHLKEAQ